MSEPTMDELRPILLREIEVGGDLKDMPCPFCKLPRCSRSTYIRCSKCGVNWGPEDNFSTDPRIAAFKAMVASAPKISKTN